MRIGDLRHRVLLQSPARTSDGMGGSTIVWEDQAQVWGAVWPVSAAEIIQAAATTLVVSHRVRIRHRNGVRPDWRVKFGDRYFAIVSIVNPNETDRTLDLMCREAAS